MKILLGKENVSVRAMTMEENPWGKYQFPTAFLEDGKVVVSVFVDDDTLINDANPTRLIWLNDNKYYTVNLTTH